MSEKAEAPLTRREILVARGAFVAGWHASQDQRVRRFDTDEAEARYPLPKVTRLRVVTDPVIPSYKYRVWNGNMIEHLGNIGWTTQSSPCPTVERVKLWADLLANPTEEVENDE